MDRAPVDRGSQDSAQHLMVFVGRVLRLAAKPLQIDTPGVLQIEEEEVRGRALAQPAGLEAQDFGRCHSESPHRLTILPFTPSKNIASHFSRRRCTSS